MFSVESYDRLGAFDAQYSNVNECRVLIIIPKFDYLNLLLQFILTFSTLIYHFRLDSQSLNAAQVYFHLLLISARIKLGAFTSDFNLQIVKNLFTLTESQEDEGE